MGGAQRRSSNAKRRVIPGVRGVKKEVLDFVHVHVVLADCGGV